MTTAPAIVEQTVTVKTLVIGSKKITPAIYRQTFHETVKIGEMLEYEYERLFGRVNIHDRQCPWYDHLHVLATPLGGGELVCLDITVRHDGPWDETREERDARNSRATRAWHELLGLPQLFIGV